jgi:hypothetical protein|tara:strand:- start:315 stop:530 length:216 start_codon:yes stop_codon:yes gene_type:complete
MITRQSKQQSKTFRLLVMPIYRSSPKNQDNQTEFEQSVSSTPMAVSLMVDSMVNMIQINRSKLDERKTDFR